MTKSTNKRMTRVQTVETAKLLEQFGVLEDGFYLYTVPHSDQEISTIVGMPVKHVQNVRLELYGQLWSPMKVAKKNGIYQGNGHAKPQQPIDPEQLRELRELRELRDMIRELRGDLDGIWPVFKVTFLRLNELLEKLGEQPMKTDVPINVIDMLRTWTP